MLFRVDDGEEPKFSIHSGAELTVFGDFFPPEGGVSLVPKRGCLLTLEYYAFPRWYEFGERQWNDILTGENRRTRRKTCPSATLSTTNPTWFDPDANPGLRGETPAANDQSLGTASFGDVTSGQLSETWHCNTHIPVSSLATGCQLREDQVNGQF
jgi:hypothetical protein